MRFEKITTITCFFFAYSFLLWGCEGNRPMGPSKVVSLNVSIPPTSEIKASLIGAATNEILYRVEGAGVSNVSGTIGPFSTLASSGSVNFSMDVPSGGPRVVSVQLNDGSTHQPLAIGAVGIDLSGSSPVSEIVVEMGSVTRNCYYTSGNSFAYGYTYGFKNDNAYFGQTNGPAYDVNFNYVYNPTHPAPTNGSGYYYFMADASANTFNASIAYLGNGSFVNYDFVPPDSQFSNSSMVAKAAFGAPVSDLQIGDIYCVKLNTVAGGHAWLQFTNQNTFPNAPSFVFRLNSNKPFYGYERTVADFNNFCSLTW